MLTAHESFSPPITNAIDPDGDAIKLSSNEAVFLFTTGHCSVVQVKVLHINTVLKVESVLRNFLRKEYKNSGYRVTNIQTSTTTCGGENHAVIYMADHLPKKEYADLAELTLAIANDPPTVCWESCDFWFDLVEA